MNAYRIKKYIGAYTAVLNGLDAIILLQESAKTLLTSGN
jgi:acetate kinase